MPAAYLIARLHINSGVASLSPPQQTEIQRPDRAEGADGNPSHTTPPNPPRRWIGWDSSQQCAYRRVGGRIPDRESDPNRADDEQNQDRRIELPVRRWLPSCWR